MAECCDKATTPLSRNRQFSLNVKFRIISYRFSSKPSKFLSVSGLKESKTGAEFVAIKCFDRFQFLA
jgi:hypothetical protein